MNTQMKEKVITILNTLKPWALALLIFLFLRSTGLVSSISSAGNSALLATGLRDAEIEEPINADFDYKFSIRDLNGKIVDLDRYKGKVVFLNIWATWCGPCRAEMGSIQQLYSKIDNKKIAFIMLSVDKQGQESKVSKYITDKQFTFPVFMPHEYLPEQLQVPSIPTTLIIGKDGKVVSKKVGATNFDTPQFKDFLEGLAKKK
jgi:thiol-disulfide isomerase/thioredoxin